VIGKPQPSRSCQAAASTALHAKGMPSARCPTRAFLPPSHHGAARGGVKLAFFSGILKTPKIRAHPLNPRCPRSIPFRQPAIAEASRSAAQRFERSEDVCHKVVRSGVDYNCPWHSFSKLSEKSTLYSVHHHLYPSAFSLLSTEYCPLPTVSPGEGLRQY
jgi:hypothetical protein